MSFGPNFGIDVQCSNCLYHFNLNSQSIPAYRLLTIQLQMQKLGTEMECPRCKGHFLAQWDSMRELFARHRPHFPTTSNDSSGGLRSTALYR